MNRYESYGFDSSPSQSDSDADGRGTMAKLIR